MGCTDQPFCNDLFQDMSWVICKECGTIQLSKLIPQEILYKYSHNSGVVGGLWSKHHKAFSEFVIKCNPKSVLEIGGGHGLLSILCHQKEPGINWIMLDPNPMPSPECRAHIIKGFFNDDFSINSNFDSLVHSHFFEHLYDPFSFLDGITRRFDGVSKQIFSIPNLGKMIKNKYTNCINFEHTFFFDDSILERLLSRTGWEVLAKENFLEDHSIFYMIGKTERKIVDMPNRFQENDLQFRDYVLYHSSLIESINKAVSISNNPVFMFGAHVFSQFLLSFGLREDSIVALLDNDIDKQGKRLSGTNLIVKNPIVLKDYDEPLVILHAGVYNNEIRSQIISSINPNTKFI